MAPSSHGAPEHPVDVISQITADHRAVEALIAGLEAGQGDGRAVLETIVRELSLHAGVEELLVYPVARELIDGGGSLVDEDLEQHQSLKEVLVRLDGADPGDESVQEDIGRVRELVAAHVDHEEGELLPRLTSAVSDEDRRQLGSLFLDAKQKAPTHPHPHAPNTPPLNVFADAVAAVVDRTRDSVTGHLRRN